MASLSSILSVDCAVAAPLKGAALLSHCGAPCSREPAFPPETSERTGFWSLGSCFWLVLWWCTCTSAGVSVPFGSAEGSLIGVDSASMNDELGVLRDFGEEQKLRLPRRESTIGRALTCLSLSQAGVSTLERNHAAALIGASFDGRGWFTGDS